MRCFSIHALAILVFLSLALFACVSQPIQLNGTEVHDYKGEKLSSISDFRENSIKGPQYVNESSYRLNITGLVENPGVYTYRQVVDNHQHYLKAVKLLCVEGWSVDILWEGVLVKDIVKEARPKPEAKTVIFHAYDGYTTSFPISYLEDNGILMAYRMNNVTIPPERGFPFVLVAESKWGYKWIKWITQIEFSEDTNYEGYWESRGYSDAGDLNSSFVK
jgi:DMSO/TMAO reductase YedYZ molybdopterin-dependent catalytic subunit